MKVGFLINSLGCGGAERVLSLLLTEFRRQQAFEEIVLFTLEDDFFYSLPEKVTFVPLYGMGKPSFLLKVTGLVTFARRLKKEIRSRGLEVVQSHLYRSNYVNILAKIFGAGHTCQIVNAGRISRYRKEGLKGKISLILVKMLYNRADKILVKSWGMKNDMETVFPIKTNVSVVYNPCDTRRIRQLADAEPVGNFSKVAEPLIVMVGRLIPLKRHQDVLKALKILKQDYPDTELVIIGDGPLRIELEESGAKMGLKDSVYYTGNIDNPFSWMNKADVLVSASESEGFPNTLIEAMAVGCPVVSSDCESGPREILAPDTNPQIRLSTGFECVRFGMLYAVGDVDALVDSIRYLLCNSELKNNYSSRGPVRADNFSLKSQAEKYKQEILEIKVS